MIKIFFILVIILLLINCSENDPVDPEPPDRVLLVLKEEGFDTLEIERGIDAEANPNSDINAIQLDWYDPADKYRIAYYNIYRSDDEEGKLFYKLIGNTENQLNPLDTVYMDMTQGLLNNHRYWYYITAVNENGKESEPSDTVHYTLIEKAIELSINNYNPVLMDSIISFTWTVSSIPSGGYYLRVEQIIGENFHPLVYLKDFKENEINYDPPQTYTISVDKFSVPVVDGDQYRWRIDCKGDDLYSGSESDWAIFTVDWSSK
jgi:hypothetical protein